MYEHLGGDSRRRDGETVQNELMKKRAGALIAAGSISAEAAPATGRKYGVG